MSKIEQFSRIINHSITTSGKGFTVPTSNDHTDETWLATDLYVGEFGINLTDDKVYVRTNNGILELAVGTASTGVETVFVYDSPNITISSTYSADAIIRNGNAYTDLGSTSYRYKDLYLGDSSSTFAKIDTNGGLWLKESTNSILVSNNIDNTNAPIEIGNTASSTSKDRGLLLNSKSSNIVGNSTECSIIGSTNVSIDNCKSSIAIGSADCIYDSGLTHSVVIGYGYSKDQTNSLEVVLGGGSSIRGIADDGSKIYDNSDYKTRQSKLTTTNSLTTNISSIPWIDNLVGGELIQVKGMILATDINDASRVYSAEITGVYSLDTTLAYHEIGTPIVMEWNSLVDNTIEIPTCEMGVTDLGVYIKVQGTSISTIKWLCTYSYQRLVNIN